MDADKSMPVAHPAAAYARMLRQLLPPGAAFSRETAAVTSRLCDGLADECARVGSRAIDLLDEWDPRTAEETLPEWETMLGLDGTGLSTAERQGACVGAMLARGGQSRAYMISVAAAYGFVATIHEGWGDVCRVGFSVGAAIYGLAWCHDWRVDVNLGASAHGVGVWSTMMEAAINAAKPAHTTVSFTYA